MTDARQLKMTIARQFIDPAIRGPSPASSSGSPCSRLQGEIGLTDWKTMALVGAPVGVSLQFVKITLQSRGDGFVHDCFLRHGLIAVDARLHAVSIEFDCVSPRVGGSSTRSARLGSMRESPSGRRFPSVPSSAWSSRNPPLPLVTDSAVLPRSGLEPS
jgi:hypothetical protein